MTAADLVYIVGSKEVELTFVRKELEMKTLELEALKKAQSEKEADLYGVK